MLVGILAGLGAGALWGLTFVAPNLVAPFSPFDLAVLRNVIFGTISVGLILLFARSLASLDRRGIAIAMALGLAGYSGYYLFVAYAVTYAGPAIVALVIGALPVLLAIAGNWQERSVAWSRLAIPLLLITLGLAVVNWGSITAPALGRSAGDIVIGFLLATGGLVMWLGYGVANAAALKARREVDSTVWTCWQGIGAALGMIAALPIGLASGASRMAELSLWAAPAAPLWFWAIATGAFSSWIATYAWVVASRRLSVALAAQLIVSETVFGLIYGFILERRWPDMHESWGAALLFAGVVIGVHVLTREREATPRES